MMPGTRFLAAAVASLLVTSASAQTALSAADAWARPFLDANGGYRDDKGNYYDLKAGVFRDTHGGVLDSYSGYTYPDGSYKSKLGDYWDAPKHTFFGSDGRVQKVDPAVTSAQMIQALRDNVKANGGYDPDLMRRSMLFAIRRDHPPAAPDAKR